MQAALSQLSLLLNPTLVAFVQGDIPMSSQNVTHVCKMCAMLSGVYTDTNDDGDVGAVLHCFLFYFSA